MNYLWCSRCRLSHTKRHERIQQTRQVETEQTRAQEIERDRGHDRGGRDRGGFGMSR